MRLLLIRLSLLGLALYLTACQAFAPAPIPALPDQPPVRSGPVPTAPIQTLTPHPPLPPGERGDSTPPAPLSGRGAGGEGLVVALPREPLTLDPGDVADPTSLIILRQIFDTLTQFKDGSAEIEPGLATTWEANADATEWTFTLRAGVKFHDGTALTADAVKFNFDRWLDPGFRAGFRTQGKQFQVWSDIFGGYRGAGSLVTDVEIISPDRIRLKLARPAAYLPAYLALPSFGLSSPAAIERLGARYGTPYEGAVGAGAYRLTAWSAEGIQLERFDEHWGGRAVTERLVFRVIGEVDAQRAALAAEQVDLAFNLPDTQAIEGVAYLSRPQLAVAYLSINQRFRPLDNRLVRQAIQAALNRATLAPHAFESASAPADQFIPPSLWGRAPTPVSSSGIGAVGESLARQLLAQAEFPNGLSNVAGPDGIGRPLELWYSRPPRGSPLTGLAQAVAEQLRAVGIRVTLREDEWASFLAERRQGRFPLYLLVHPLPSTRVEAVGDPHVFLNGLFGPLTAGETGYSNGEVSRRLREAESTADTPRRATLYTDVAAIVATDVPRIPLVYPSTLAALRQEWTDLVLSPVGVTRLAGVRRKD